MDVDQLWGGANTVVLAPARELDIAVAPQLRALLASAHAPGATVVLDLDGVEFLDSSALGIVLAAQRRLSAAGGGLVLVHVTDRLHRVLRICGLAGRLVGTGHPLRGDRTVSVLRRHGYSAC